MEPNSHFVGILHSPLFLRHLTGGFHPERPSRLIAIEEALTAEGLLSPKNSLSPRPASPDELALVHSPDYISLVEREAKRCALHGWTDGSHTLSSGDVQICPDSYQAACFAAGGAFAAIDSLLNGNFQAVFAAVRPPGHHACKEKGMGFCLFNNAALAARYAQTKHGIGTVLIVDWDVHHGNGTQEIAWDDPSILYFSTHQWPLYPGTGSRDEVGCGNICNIPIEAGSSSRDKVLDAFREELPVFLRGRMPGLVIISAGFDGHRLDPLGGFNLTGDDFAELTRLTRLAVPSAPLLSLLEGGYSLEALAESVPKHVYSLGCCNL